MTLPLAHSAVRTRSDRGVVAGPVDGREALAPGWVVQRPAEFSLGLGVGGAAGLGCAHHRVLARDPSGEPGGYTLHTPPRPCGSQRIDVHCSLPLSLDPQLRLAPSPS